MGSAARVLAVARAEVGYDEGPNNQNKYAPAVGHADFQPWCASFVVWCFDQAGVDLPSRSAYTPTMANGFRQAGKVVPWSEAQPGDVALFFWANLGRIAHVGIIEKLLPKGKVQVLEGNTNAAGSRTGGSVLRKVRSRSLIPVVGRPDYDAAPSLLRVPAQRPAVPAEPAGPDPAVLEDDMAVLVRQASGPRTQTGHVFVVSALAKRHVRTRAELNELVKAGLVEDDTVRAVPKSLLDGLVTVGKDPRK